VLVAQSGGATTVINASLAGIIDEARASGAVDRVLGARFGAAGLLDDALIDLTGLADERIARLRRTPSAALGTSRHRPSDDDLDHILELFRRRGIGIFLSIGGNDTADSAARLHTRARLAGVPLRVVVVPKTIDNDLAHTDHCPGYGSAARFVALAVRDAAADTAAMATTYPVKIVEVMGRNAGWLVAAGALLFPAHRPRPILCLPERPVGGIDQLTQLVQERLRADGYAVLVVPETMRWQDGTPAGGTTPVWVDPFGHAYHASPADALTRELSVRLGLRARFDKPGTIARAAMHAVSEVDLAEAEQAGREALRRALAGESGVMVTMIRVSDEPYQVRFSAVPAGDVAGVERLLPDEFISAGGHDCTTAFRRYALPLIGPAPDDYEVLV
jgi:6-phosphofructokinase 1